MTLVTAADPIRWPEERIAVPFLHLMGIDHERLTFRYSGRDFRLTDVHGRVVQGILA